MALTTGRTFRELDALLVPGELNLYAAASLIDGPWWGQRDDVLAAMVAQTIAASVGTEVELRKCLPVWDPEKTKPVLLPWAEAKKLLLARCDGGRPVDR